MENKRMVLNINSSSKHLPVWPNFFIVGAAKAGTTSLYECLRHHPQVYMSPVKEPHYFSRVKANHWREHFVRSSTEDYAALFEGAAGFPAVGEASPSYLWDEGTPYQIKQKVPEARTIILLRDPVERAYSHYLMDVKRGRQKEPFYEALLSDAAREKKEWGSSHLYVELGRYASQVSRYLEAFGSEQVKIVLFEDFKRDTVRVLYEVCTFLGINAEAVGSITTHGQHNTYSAPRGELAKRVLGNGQIRRVAQCVVPKRVRPYVRDKLLLSRGKKPEPDRRAVEYLAAKYEDELERLEQTLGWELPELRKEW